MLKSVFLIFLLLTTTSFKTQDKSRTSNAGDLLSKIGDAREALEPERVRILKGVVGTRRVKVGRRSYREVAVEGIVGREMAIAVMDAEGKISVGRAIKRDGGLEVLTRGITLKVRRENGINSDIAVIEPAGGRVLAVKYPISNERNRFGQGGEEIEAIYTPYSPEIKTEKIIEQGIKVQDDFIDKAYDRLEKRGVRSHAFPGRKVADVIRKDVLTVLLMNEHIDPGLFKSEASAKIFVEQVLTVIATNKEKAYAYSISSAGARGLVQMIPSTYSLIANKYPTAGLNPSFVTGMGDPVNAVMAQVLLCDADWQSIRNVSDVSAERIGPYLAAAYNGGVGRVLSVLRHDQQEWMDSPDMSRKPTMTVTKRVPVKKRTRKGRSRTVYVLKSYSQPIFRSETSKYVSQYHWINDVFVAKDVKGFKPMKDDE